MDDIVEFLKTRASNFHFVYSTVQSYVETVKTEIKNKKISLQVF
jgi:hypothetical protein